ncbi:VOC family protein [Actinokineospora fastidiosa]|nr:VOC family protein [Actinokineospora fastidiosa]
MEITGLHHIGHVVRDMTAALDGYRRLGFAVPAPSYPALPGDDGEPVPFGAANTHADFAADFLELATVLDPGGAVPADARVVPLQAPPEVLPTLLERVTATSATLAACLERFEGLHILMFSASDIDAAADRLRTAGVGHGGVTTVRRPAGDEVETVRYLEIDGERPGAVAEGRVGVVADLDPRLQAARLTGHPNGATGLADVLLCATDVDETQDRYERYLGRKARVDGKTRVFAIGDATVTLVAASDLDAVLPGVTPPAVPALVATTVAVRDLGTTRQLLQDNGFPLRETPAGEIFTSALGAVIAFRPEN